MKLQHFHPTAGITVLCFAGAVAVNFFSLDRAGRDATYFVAALLLASPFAVLLLGHLTLARSWRRNAFLAGGSVLFGLGWAVASFALRWFQPGWGGVAFFALVLAVLAGLYVLLALLIPEPPNAQAV